MGFAPPLCIRMELIKKGKGRVPPLGPVGSCKEAGIVKSNLVDMAIVAKGTAPLI